MRRFDTHYRLGDEDRAVPETFNTITRDMDNRVHALEELRGEILELRDTVLYQAAQRIDEFIIPGLESLRLIQSGGFLVAEIADETAVSFIEGSGSLAVDESYREFFRPTPFVAMVREGSPDDWAIAQVLDYIEETGVLSYDIVAVSGDAGPWQDVIVSATAGSVMAQIEFLASARLARDEAVDAKDLAVPAALTAITKAGEALGHAGDAEEARDKAAAWAEGTTPGGPGTKSAKEHALAAAQSALDAATFDPSSYYTKTELDHVTTGKADKSALGGAAALDVGTTAGTVAAGDDSRILGAIAAALLTTRGDIIYRDASAPARLAKGTSGQVLTMGENDPVWDDPSGLPSNVVFATKTDTASRTSSAFANASGLSVTITPSSATSRILVFAVLYVGTEGGIHAFFRLLRGSTAILQGNSAGSRTRVQGSAIGADATVDRMVVVPLLIVDAPATTSAVTYNVSWASSSNAGAIYLNRTNDDADDATTPRAASILVALEIGAAP